MLHITSEWCSFFFIYIHLCWIVQFYLFYCCVSLHYFGVVHYIEKPNFTLTKNTNKKDNKLQFRVLKVLSFLALFRQGCLLSLFFQFFDFVFDWKCGLQFLCFENPWLGCNHILHIIELKKYRLAWWYWTLFYQ